MIKKNQFILKFLVFCLIAFNLSLSVAFALDNDCPSPHNDCTTSCGTSCTYYTCADPKNTPQYVITELPYTARYETEKCQDKLTDFTFDEIQKKYSIFISGVGTQTVSLKEIPSVVQLLTWACLPHFKKGSPCPWTEGLWGECDATCGYDTVIGYQHRKVQCDAPNGECAGSKPETAKPCTKTCPSRPAETITGTGACGVRCPYSGEGLFGPGDFNGGGGF